MSKIQTPKNLRIEDFKGEEKDLIEKIGFVVNPFMNDVYNALNANIDYDNLKRQLIDVSVRIGTSGGLVNPPQIRLTKVGRPRGIQVLNAINLNNPMTYPTTAPFVSWTNTNDIINLLNVTGLQNGSEYRLTLEITLI